MNYKVLKIALTFHLLQSIAIFWVFWMCSCFVLWEFYNPTEWIFRVQYWKDTERLTLLFFVLIYWFGSVISWYDHLKKQKI